MPSRVINGEKLWGSLLLAKVKPGYRAEYANLLPLALANGSFEGSDRKVWKTIYAENREDISLRKCSLILAEFERVGMLFRWQDESGRVWGYFPNIEKPGRLPPLSRLKQRHEKLGQLPPLSELNRFLEKRGLPPIASCDLPPSEREVNGTLASHTGSHGIADGRPVVPLGSGSGSGESPASQSSNNPNTRSASQGEPETERKKYPVENGLRTGGKPGLVADLENAIHRNDAFNAFDDAYAIRNRRETAKETFELAIEWMTEHAVKSLFQNRGFKELAGVGEQEVLKALSPKLEKAIPVWLALKDYDTRKRQAGGKIFKLVAETAAGMPSEQQKEVAV